MTLFLEAVTAILFFLAVSGLIYYIKAVCRLPFNPGRDITLQSTLQVSGNGENLQSVVEALLWLQGDCGRRGKIVIDIRYANEPARKQAEILAKIHKEIALLEQSEG